MSTIIITGNHNTVNISNANNPEHLSKYTAHKQKSKSISSILAVFEQERGNFFKAAQILSCGSVLAFRHYHDIDKTKSLISANFCRHPICPMCAWRLSLKWATWLTKAAESLIKDGLKPYHLILTMPSVEDISDSTIKRLRKAARTFYTELPISVSARAETIEITVNNGLYHPHIHAVLFSPDTYTHSIQNLEELRRKWFKFMPSDYGYSICALYPISDINRGISECCKYVMSPKTKGELTPKAVRDIAEAIHGVRKYITDRPMQKAITEAKRDIRQDRADITRSLMQCGWHDVLYKWNGYSYEES